jgi:TolB-like protein/tetratricopeptide (TPR) repeat protein
MPEPALLQTLKERKLVQWALAYLAGAWVLFEVSDAVGSRWNLPDVLFQALFILLAIGFFVALVFAWYHGEKGRQRVSGPELLIMAALLAIAAGVVGIWSRGGAHLTGGQSEPDVPTATEEDDRPSIAVLPFVDMSPEGDQEYFADGIAEEILNALTKVPGLKVAARTSAFSFRGADTDVRTVGERLAVSTVLEGSVRKEENRVRISAQLIEVQDGFHVWSETYDRELESVFAVQDEIAREVAKALEVELLPGPRTGVVLASQTNPDAYQAYLRGRHAFHQLSSLGWQEAIEQFTRSIEIDPTFAPAHAGLASTHFIRGFFGGIPFLEAVPLARRVALHALELDDGLGEPHAILGYIALYHDWDWESAELELQRALELNPTDALSRHGLADLFTVLGDAEEGLRQVELGREVDPMSYLANFPVAGHLLFVRRYEDVIVQVHNLRELFPDRANSGSTFLGSALWQLGRFDESLEEYGTGWSNDPDFAQALEEGLEEAGPRGAMRAGAEYLASQYQNGGENAFDVASCYARAGENQAALEWLERGYEARLPESLHVVFYPEFDALRPDPRFQDLLRRLNIPQR